MPSQTNPSKRAKAGQPSRAEEKRARLAAAQADLARDRRRTKQRWLWVAGIVAVVVVAIALLDVYVLNRASHARKSSAAAASARASAVVQRVTAPPWDVPADPGAAVAAAGLPMLGTEGTALHIHAHVDVLVNGKAVAVPAEIGIDEAARKISPLHTHDTTGVVHVESPTQRDFTLGEFFKEWEVSLGADHLGSLRTDGTNSLKVYVNGKAYTGDPTAIVLHAHDEIALVYGTAAQQQSPPASYTFASGL